MKFAFTDKHYEFLAKEFNTDKCALSKMTESELDDFYEEILQIEITETIDADDNPLTERGETAVEIVNIMADALGYVQDDEWEAFLNEDDETPAPQRAVV